MLLGIASLKSSKITKSQDQDQDAEMLLVGPRALSATRGQKQASMTSNIKYGFIQSGKL